MTVTTASPQPARARSGGGAAAARRERLLLALGAPALAVAAAFAVTSLVLLATGKEPFNAFRIMGSYGFQPPQLVAIVNKATPYYLAAVAVAIGFRMNLFNIGVDGQYRLAAFFAAAAGGAVSLPAAAEIPLIVLVAMAVGAAWAAIAGFLKVTRGVSEVITTIMLNAIAASVIGYFLQDGRLGVLHRSENQVTTRDLPRSAHFFAFSFGADGQVWGFIVVAALVGVAYWFTLNRTRFGFDLRTVGRSEPAARAAGVNVRRMVVVSMLVSGALAGLIGMPTLLQSSYQYSTDFPTGIGFTGIAIALLGRNNPIGIGFGALLWAFLDVSGQQLEFENYDKEIVGVIQGVIVLCVVIAYEVVRRYGIRLQRRRVGAELAFADAPSDEAVETPDASDGVDAPDSVDAPDAPVESAAGAPVPDRTTEEGAL
jgi:simple sugar transport system permease protein